MTAANKIMILMLALGMSLPVIAQGGKGGPPPGQRRGPGFGQSPNGRAAGKGHFGEWLRNSKNLTAEQKQKALQDDPKFKSLPPEQQERLKSRLDWFNSLSPDRQQKILNRMAMWERMSPEQHQRARALTERLRGLPDERRSAVRKQCRMMGDMSVNDRQKTMNSDQFRKSFNDDERDIVARCLEFRDNNNVNADPSLDEDK